MKYKKILLSLSIVGILCMTAIFGVNYYVLYFSKHDLYSSVKQLQPAPVGIVFGASARGGKPSDILRDRLKVAYMAYNKGYIKNIIVSGDNSNKQYNEPRVMQQYLIQHGVPEKNIYLDYAGFDTYDTLYRAREIFDVKQAVLFTQDFHLKRAIYISKRLGIQTQGVATNLQRYLGETRYNIREILARCKAFLDVEIFKSKPKFLGEKIEILSDEKLKRAKQQILK